MQFENIFAGNEERYLTFSKMTQRDDGKMVPNYRTVDTPVADEMWAQHLSGKASLGLSPLRDGMVKWGAVDVDLYPFLDDREQLESFMEAWSDPCLVARTKSGGVHIIAFSKDWVPAERMRRYLEIKRDSILRGDALANANEIFPKQSEGSGSQMNLPAFGKERQPLGWQGGGLAIFITEENPINWDAVAHSCFVSDATIADTLLSALTPKAKPKLAQRRERKKSAGGFARPRKSEGRRDYVFKCAASARSRGADEEQLREVIEQANADFENPEHEYGHKGMIDDKARLATIHKEIMKFKQGVPSDLPYDVVERMNAEWALMIVNGRVEFLHQESGVCYPLKDFTLRTKPLVALIDGKSRQMSELWIADTDRLEYDGIVIESPDYDGPAFNMFEGWACDPCDGDASLWVHYIEDILCSGDKALAHWVMTYLADAVQRPWSLHPGTALALTGGAGAGKTFLGRAMRKLLGNAHAQQIAESNRMFSQFNRGLFGATFVLCEEALFAGSKAQAATAKAFITSDVWTYEQKHLAAFEGKNVHRIIATTNESQAVHIDHDDRRWTVIEVPTRFDHDAHGPEARAFWEPYYKLVDETPGIVLRYLLEYKVDRDLIGYGHVTQAKSEDKLASDPLLMVMHDIAMTGVCPDDLRGDGKISSATLAREVKAQGGWAKEQSRTYTNQLRKKFGATTTTGCIHIERTHVSVGQDGLMTVAPIDRKDRSGVQMPPLETFRASMSRISGVKYPDGDTWGLFKLSGPDGTFNEGDPESVERYARDNGHWVEDQPPF